MEKRSGHILAGAVGNLLEFYDFAIFAYLVPVIGVLFFPSEDPLASLVKAYGVFAAGYLIRPLGAVLFGYFGDRVGRKKMLQISVVVMAVPTTLVGCLPTYDQVGVLAAFLIVALRLLQGLSVGGEMNSSVSFLGEIARPGRRGLIASIATTTGWAGYLLGSAVATLMHTLVENAPFHLWGWRIPFFVGALLGGVGFLLRISIPETPIFNQVRNSGQVKTNPFTTVFREMPGSFLCLVGLSAFVHLGNIIYIWMPIYVTHILKPPINEGLSINTMTMCVVVVMTLFGGWLSDRIDRKALFVLTSLTCAVVSYPLFQWIDQGTVRAAVVSQLIFAVPVGIAWGTLPIVMVDLFPPSVRMSGGSAFSITTALVGGTAPLMATWFIAWTGNIAAPAYLVMLLAFVGVASAFGIREYKAGSSHPGTRASIKTAQ